MPLSVSKPTTARGLTLCGRLHSHDSSLFARHHFHEADEDRCNREAEHHRFYPHQKMAELVDVALADRART
jgi:hypothetical protein